MRRLPVTEVGVSSASGSELQFHRRRDSNVSVSADGLTASVMHTSREFDAAFVTSCRPLNDDELFEFRIDRVIETWSASLEAGTCCCCLPLLLCPVISF